MYWSKNNYYLKKDEKVVIANGDNGQWIRMSSEVYKIIKEIIQLELEIERTTEFFENKEDYDFIKSIYDDLCRARIIINKEIEDFNKIASIQLTNRCNLHCTHCCVSAGDGDLVDLDKTDMKEIIDKVIRWNPKNIMLSGGEPLLYKNFFEILSYIRTKYDGKIILSTNALLINEKNVEQLLECVDAFEISIDGVDEETCSLVRGKGVFDRVCQKIKLLQKQGANKINLSMIFSDKNDDLRPKFMELNKKLGTIAVCRSFTPVGRGLTNRALLSNIGEDKSYISNDYLDKHNNEPFGVSTCRAGLRELFIDYKGNIYPCPSYIDPRFVLGNILKINNLNDLLNSKKNFTDKIRSNRGMNFISRCEGCEVKPFCWTCPGELVNIYSENEFIDRCKKKKPILVFRVWEKNINM